MLQDDLARKARKKLQKYHGNKKQLRELIKCVRGCVVSHNFLLNVPCDEDWCHQDDNDNEPEPRADLLAASVTVDHSRRDELMCYFSEIDGTNIF